MKNNKYHLNHYSVTELLKDRSNNFFQLDVINKTSILPLPSNFFNFHFTTQFWGLNREKGFVRKKIVSLSLHSSPEKGRDDPKDALTVNYCYQLNQLCYKLPFKTHQTLRFILQLRHHSFSKLIRNPQGNLHFCFISFKIMISRIPKNWNTLYL